MPRQTPARLSLMKGTHWGTSQVESITQQSAQLRHILWYLGYEIVKTTSLCFLRLCFILQCHNKWATNSSKPESACDLFCNDVGVNPQGSR